MDRHVHEVGIVIEEGKMSRLFRCFVCKISLSHELAKVSIEECFGTLESEEMWKQLVSLRNRIRNNVKRNNEIPPDGFYAVPEVYKPWLPYVKNW